MAKEKDPSLSKEERKALKRAEKEKKRSDADGVHKSKDSKREKKKERAALAEKVANAIENGAVVVEEKGVVDDVVKSDVEDDDDDEKKKKKVLMRPVGALVPFANPLADEKVAKKVFRGVKKGVYSPYFSYVLKAVDGGMFASTLISLIQYESEHMLYALLDTLLTIFL